MADEDEHAALADIALALIVDFADQRTGGVQHGQAALLRFFLHAARHAVGAEHRHGVGRNLGQVFDEARALGFERFDHALVVHDLVAHIDRRPVFLQRAFHDLDRAHDACTKSARLSQNHLHPSCSILIFRARRIHCRACVYLVTATRRSPPRVSNTFATMPLASRPALAYIAVGLSWSINSSGSTIERNRRPLSSRPSWARACSTCEPKPPMAPSSMVTRISCSRASRRTRSTSSGLQNRASATVVDRP